MGSFMQKMLVTLDGLWFMNAHKRLGSKETLQADIEVMIGAAISKNISRGGDVDRAIRASYGVQRIGRHGL